MPIGIYDINDIIFDYNEFISNVPTKITSQGEEFGASATDSFGNKCAISIELSDGGSVIAGQTQTIVLVVTDKAGNRVVSKPITGIKIYDTPQIVVKREGTIDLNYDPYSYFDVLDSFGEKLYFTAEIIGDFAEGNTVSLKISATDAANNQVEAIYEGYVVKKASQAIVHFVHYDGTEETLFVDKIDYVFPTKTMEGWEYVWTSLPDNEGTLFDGTVALTDETLTVYAAFIKEVTFNANGGSYSGETPTTVIYGNTYNFGKATRYNYQFLGWYSEADEGTQYVGRNGGNVTVGEDFPNMLYAQWAPIYSITYNLNGGTKPSYNYPSTYVSDGITTVSLGTPTKAGHTFAGWYTESTFVNRVTAITGDMSGNKTLYAKWTANQYTITYYVSGVKKTKTVTYGENYTLPVLTSSGKTFIGYKLSTATETSKTIGSTSYKATCVALEVDKNGNSLKAYNYTENKTFVVMFSSDLDYMSQNTVMSGSLGMSHYWDYVLAPGTYTFSWNFTPDSRGSETWHIYIGGQKFTTKTGSKTITISDTSYCYEISAGIYRTLNGYGTFNIKKVS